MLIAHLIEVSSWWLLSAAAEDRNFNLGNALPTQHLYWRSPLAVAEDRNTYDASTYWFGTLPGGRRPQRPRIATGPTSARASRKPYWRRSSAAAEDRNQAAAWVTKHATRHGGRRSAAADDRNLFVRMPLGWPPSGGRRPRRPGIATSTAARPS